MGRLPAPCDDISFQLTAARRRLERGGLAGFTQGCFNSQPPEGGWLKIQNTILSQTVSTHSRPKAAGGVKANIIKDYIVSTHSRPKAAGIKKIFETTSLIVSTHSRPKAAGIYRGNSLSYTEVSTHSRPKAAGFIKHGNGG